MPRAPAGRGRRGRQRIGEEELGDGLPWPGYRAQQRLLDELPPEELEAARQGAQALVEHGYGALPAGWLDAGDDAQPQRQRRGRDRLADLFDAA